MANCIFGGTCLKGEIKATSAPLATDTMIRAIPSNGQNVPSPNASNLNVTSTEITNGKGGNSLT